MKGIIFILLAGMLNAESCSKDSECSKYYNCVHSECKHKQLFPLEPMEILGTALIFSCSALANAAGQGGGPLMTLILLILFSYEPSFALPMVQLIILGGSGIGFLIRVPMRHPKKDRPLIDYYTFTLFAPTLLIGTTIGVILSLIFPSWLILALLTLVLIYLSYTSAQMSIRIFKKENKEKKKVADERLMSIEEDCPTVVDEGLNEMPEELKKIITSEKKWFPVIPILIFFLVYGFAIFSSFLRGSSMFPSIIGVIKCTPGYWIMDLIIFEALGLFTISVVWYIVRITRKKQQLGYNFDPNDIIWNSKTLTICIVFGLLAGIGSSLLSFGGALILGPVMLKLGFRPEVSAGTSTAIIVLTSSISIIQFAIAGKLELVYGIWMFSFSLLGSLAGIRIIRPIVNKYQRGSIMVIMLTLMLGLCAVLTPAYGILSLFESGSFEVGFRSYCN